MDASLIQHAAASAAQGQQYPKATLYVVATPIGNLADMTLRAVHALTLVDAVACEDTRVTAGLLRPFGIDKPLIALHEHNEAEAAQRIVERLAAGDRIAYASDAGTPAVSDPGARLVAAVRAAGHRVLPLPGASSVTTALSAAGDAASRGFSFIGFASSKATERAAQLQQLARREDTLLLFEAPHRIEALCAALADAMPTRNVTLCRELSKQFESIDTMAARALPAWLAGDADRRRGEFVLVLHALPPAAADADTAVGSAEPLLRTLMAALPLKQAVALAAEASGAPRNALYQRALALKANAADTAGTADPADET